MSELDTDAQIPEPAPAPAPVVEPKAKARKPASPAPAAKAVAPVGEFKFYRTPSPIEQAFTIFCASGKTWLPYGFDKDRRLMFRVASEDAERFERHVFFKQGRLEGFNHEPHD